MIRHGEKFRNSQQKPGRDSPFRLFSETRDGRPETQASVVLRRLNCGGVTWSSTAGLWEGDGHTALVSKSTAIPIDSHKKAQPRLYCNPKIYQKHIKETTKTPAPAAAATTSSNLGIQVLSQCPSLRRTLRYARFGGSISATVRAEGTSTIPIVPLSRPTIQGR